MVTEVERVSRARIRMGQWTFILFVVLFATLITLRGTLHPIPSAFKLFTNLFLAGTIIFGGGPVVIPLLRQYIVDEGWVSSRDFLIGLAIIQAFPGPNFNFAVYLGALAARSIETPSPAGAILGFVGIFFPGQRFYKIVHSKLIIPPRQAWHLQLL
jgi:hypothetical protein